MNVSRSSWHYRLYRYLHNIVKGPAYLNPATSRERKDPALPSTLCPYAWAIFLSLVGALVLALVFLATTPFFAVGFAFRQVLRLDARWRDGTRPKRTKPERKPEPPREKKPSIVRAYLRSRKEKVCPTIRLVD